MTDPSPPASMQDRIVAAVAAALAPITIDGAALTVARERQAPFAMADLPAASVNFHDEKGGQVSASADEYDLTLLVHLYAAGGSDAQTAARRGRLRAAVARQIAADHTLGGLAISAETVSGALSRTGEMDGAPNVGGDVVAVKIAYYTKAGDPYAQAFG